MPRCAPLAVALAVVACQARAQDAEPALGTVTVTAQPGVAQDRFETPASVDVIEGSVLRNGQLQVNLSESLQRVPGVVAQNRQNYAQDLQISIRGFGARSTFGVRGLRLYADGIPATSPDGQGQVSHFDLASAARVEVLRGPFSALYGNSSGGVISLFTAEGGPDTVAEVSAAVGPDGVRRGTLQLSGQQGRARYRLATTLFETDGWRDHSAARRDSFNGKVRIDAGEGTGLTLLLNQVHLPDTQDPLGLTRAEWQADPRQASPAALAFNTRKSVDQLQAGAVLEHRMSMANTLQLTAYAGQRDTVQYQAVPVAVQVPVSHPGGVIDLARRYQGLDARWVHRGRTDAGPYTVTAGTALEQTRDERRGLQNFAGPVLGVQGALRRDESNRARSADLYLQGQWVLGERWSASAGLRHSRVALQSADRYIVTGNADDSGERRLRTTSPVAGVVFHASEQLNFYAAWGRGFETPTLNELAYRADGTAGLNPQLRPANSRQWELGAKARLNAGWQGTLAYFEARTRDEIVVQSNSGGRSSFQNAPGTLRRGIELAADGRWGGGWSAQLAATWLDAQYRQGFLTCAGAPCAAPTAAVAAGNRLPGIPRTNLFAELAWAHRPWGLELALDWRRVGSVPVDDANSDAAPAYQVFGLRGGLEQRAGRWTLREFIRIDNVADRGYVGSVIVNEGNRRFFEPAPGRRWLAGVSAAYKF